MNKARISAFVVAVIVVIVLITFSRGSTIVESQVGCPANGTAFRVNYFGFPLKGYWTCQASQKFPQGGSVSFYKAGSIFKVAVDAALGLALVLLPALYLLRSKAK